MIPIAWFFGTMPFLPKKEKIKFGLRWTALLAGCLALAYFMLQKLCRIMGGRCEVGEMMFYGWMLFAFFAVVQIIKKPLEIGLRRLIRFPASEKVRNAVVKPAHFIIMLLIVIPFFLAMTSIHRAKVGDAFDPKMMMGVDYEDVVLRTQDGLKIKGWFVPSDSDKAVMIAHGLGANKSNFIGTVDMWHQLGYNVLIFDFRGHGRSDGHTVTFGYKERFDVMAGLKYLTEEKRFPPERIIGYGVSFGGAAMIHAARETKGFSKIIIDSSFASLDDMADAIIAQQFIVPAFCSKLIKELGLFFIRVDVGFDIREHSPGDIVGELTGTPILFIHGKGDPLINWRQTGLLYEKAGDPKQVVFLETQGHFGTINDGEYVNTIRRFVGE
jgi:pimeloyl-ACP methyl ester carboxylesterase